MGYVLVGLLVLVIVAVGVTVLVIGARKGEAGPAAADPDAPLGDTSEHSESEPDRPTVAERTGDGAHAARPVDGGEGEGGRRI
jgi:hypothetical protein